MRTKRFGNLPRPKTRCADAIPDGKLGSTSESIVSVLTESELKEGKRMFICVKHGFAACMEMRDCNEGATRFQCKI